MYNDGKLEQVMSEMGIVLNKSVIHQPTTLNTA
jgi:uncharacterized protein YejL (UPF0352 family)